MSDTPIRKDALQGDIIHVYDGIEEADNQLPNWWVAVFLGTVAFGIAYWFGFVVYAARPTPEQEYAQERAEIEQAQRTQNESSALSDDVLIALASDAKSVEQGRSIFKATCVACHGERAEGKIGPNLTDDHWLHGGAPLQIHNTIQQGVVQKGMPAWGPVLGTSSVRQVAAFVLTLRNSNVPGKEPQGEVYVSH